MNEYLLAVDNYKKPAKYSNEKAEYYVILKLILMNKGENQLFPDMGVGLIKKYRYMTEDNIPELENDIESQISKYLPELMIDTVTVQIINENLTISVSSSQNNTNYNYTGDQFGLKQAIEDNNNEY